MIKYAKSPAKERDRRAYAALFFHRRLLRLSRIFPLAPARAAELRARRISVAARRALRFHGAGTLFPVYHERDYRIELAITTEALSPVETLEFSKAGFRAMFADSPALAAALVDWYSSYVNLLLYDTAHQEYNCSFLKLCNLLYLLAPAGGLNAVTQEELADILGTSRVNLTRGLAQLRNEGVIRTLRGRIEISDRNALARHCSLETVEPSFDTIL